MATAAEGADYLLRGLELITRPGIRRFVFIPLSINALLFGLFLWFAFDQFSLFVDWLDARIPEWLQWISWLLWPLFAATAALFVFFTFSVVANIIGAPFNGLLAEAVEHQLTGRRPSDHSSMGALIADFIPSILNELRKLAYFATRAIPLLLLFLVPGLNMVAPFLWMAFSAWMLAVEYSDYPMANHGIRFPDQRRLLGRRRWLSLGFGGATLTATMIPIVNFLVMPVAVAGATAMWVECLSDESTT